MGIMANGTKYMPCNRNSERKKLSGDAHDEHHHKAEGTHLVESLRTEQCQEQIEKGKEAGEYDDLPQYGVTTVVVADTFSR